MQEEMALLIAVEGNCSMTKALINMNSNMGKESLMGMESAGMGSIMGKGSTMGIGFARIDLLLELQYVGS